jgi:NADH-quinone oxidoreductase subunit A
VLKSYLPALVFLLLGIGIGTAFSYANHLLGPKRPGKVKSEPYESGLPSDVRRSFLYPVALQLDAFGVFALVETIVFVVLLLVAFVFVWRRGALEWK